MKYLKKFNENKNVVEEFFKPLINFELIDNLEGMIVDFLDEDWTLIFLLIVNPLMSKMDPTDFSV